MTAPRIPPKSAPDPAAALEDGLDTAAVDPVLAPHAALKQDGSRRLCNRADVSLALCRREDEGGAAAPCTGGIITSSSGVIRRFGPRGGLDMQSASCHLSMG